MGGAIAGGDHVRQAGSSHDGLNRLVPVLDRRHVVAVVPLSPSDLLTVLPFEFGQLAAGSLERLRLGPDP
jgi:hypothetical protein